MDSYTCRRGFGYTKISSVQAAIQADLTYFVPLNETLEIWQLTLTNQRSEPANLSAFSAIEFCLWDALDDAANYQRNFNTGEVEVEDGVIYHRTEYRERRDHFAYFACSSPICGYDTQREAFLGPSQGWERPLTVEQGQATNSHAHGWAPIGLPPHQINFETGRISTNQRVQKWDSSLCSA